MAKKKEPNTNLLGSKDNPFASKKQAMNRAKDLIGIPRSQQPDRQWQITDDISYKGTQAKNMSYHPEASHSGRMYEFTDAKGNKKVITLHTKDGMLHVHAGEAKDNPFDYDFKDPNNRYKKVPDPNLNNDHHLFVECK